MTDAERLGWITGREAAKRLGVAYPTISYYVRIGRLTPLRLPPSPRRKGMLHYFDPKAVEEARQNPPPRIEAPCGINPTETDCAYMAGMIDADGSIVISRRASPSLKGNVSHQVILQVVNCSATLMQWLTDQFGGLYREARAANEKHRAWYTWKCSGTTALHILHFVRPYLVVKSRQADLAFRFQERMNQYNAGRWKPLTDEELAWRDEQKAEMSRLNREG